MDNSLYYLAVNRQVGLAAELDMIANNIANLDTTGFRREGLASGLRWVGNGELSLSREEAPRNNGTQKGRPPAEAPLPFSFLH